MKNKEIFVCRGCGYESVKWLGKCPSCGQWNTFEQAMPLSAPASRGGTGGKRAAPVSQIGDISANEDIRYQTGISELDRVLGGGLVKGSLVLLGVAKENDISIILVGHVTKEGNLAGPRVLEHIVDAVFHFEGEQNHAYRILRAIKNRYGATNEIAVFEMRDSGLRQVTNPSAMLLSERPQAVSGSCVVCVLEGSRPILAEVQALITKSGFPTPRRMATGFDYNRMQMLLAVLEKRAGYFFGSLDAYINVVGGLRLDEPASDLPIALAMVSGLRDRPIPADMLAIGEIGLGGEIRSVIRIEDRVQEAERMGFERVLVPASCVEALKAKKFHIRVIGAANVREALKAAAEISPREPVRKEPEV